MSLKTDLLQGLIMNQSVGKNVIVTTLDSLVNRFKLLDHEKNHQNGSTKASMTWQSRSRRSICQCRPSPAATSSASCWRNGSPQSPKCLILDGPTIGIDVAAKFAIHEIIRDLAKQGVAIILISEEVGEVFHNCNRIIVMRKGRICAGVRDW